MTEPPLIGYNPTSDPPEDLYDIVTEPPLVDGNGYNYPVPENQLNPPRPTTTQAPIEVAYIIGSCLFRGNTAIRSI